MSALPRSNTGPSRLGTRAAVALVLAITSALRWPFLHVPLERDEGEYAYFGQLILHGGLPYRDAYNMKPPGIYYAHAVALGLCGETAPCVRLAVVVVALASAWLFYRIARHWFAGIPALAATAAFALLAANHRLLGFAAKAEQYVLLFALAGLAAGFSALRRDRLLRWFGAGLACGVATTMKPTGIWFAAYLAWRCSAGYRGTEVFRGVWALAALAAGLMLPWMVAFGGFLLAEALPSLWFWAFTYAREYATGVPFIDGLRLAGSAVAYIVPGAPLVWALAVVGWVLPKGRGAAVSKLDLWVFLAASVAAVASGWRFSEHYFLLLAPAAAVGVGMAAAFLGQQRRLVLILLGGCLAISGLQEWARFRGHSPTEVARAIYGRNPFPEAVEIAERIRAATATDEPIAVIGSEPQIYFYAQRRAATGFVYTYPLMEAHPFAAKMQEQMIEEIEGAQPRFLVLVHVPSSWSRRPESLLRILEWSAEYANTRYHPYGLIEIPERGPSRSVWGEPARTRAPASDFFISVFERAP